jgi:S1-C subfamily serine protease
MLESVVFLRTSDKTYDVYSPWRSNSGKKSTGSGCAIMIGKKKFILTNAHCVHYSNFIECLRYNSSQAFVMQIYDISLELDLALLEPINCQKEFWSGLFAYKLSDKLIMPVPGESVSVIGFPQGGVNPSTSKGNVSRYSHFKYNGFMPNVVIQTDAAINPGNSGGPCFIGEELIGLAFAHQANMQNICFVIPIFLIQHFCNEINLNGYFQGVCDLDIEIDSLENNDLREYFAVAQRNGALIKTVAPLGNCAKILQNGDVLMSIDDYSIDENGLVLFKKNLMPYWHIVRMKSIGESINIEFVRGKKHINEKIVIRPYAKKILPILDRDISHKYYIFGGLAFIALSNPYLFRRGEAQQSRELDLCKYDLFKYINKYCDTEDSEICILKTVYSDHINLGYRYTDIQLLKINDISIKNLQQVYTICESPIEKFAKFEFENNIIIVLNWKLALESSENIAKQHINISYHNFKETIAT